MLKIFVFIFLLAVVVNGDDFDDGSSGESAEDSTNQPGEKPTPRLHQNGGGSGPFEPIPETEERKEYLSKP
ncbi:hypothetical protein V5799_009812 [Amblyomma americanum]|uniref:Secreted protein n=1 Tax=Amblyomma americanum TaxID=6943 RepID=A0AAQ4FAQ4_AMBAM